MTLSLAQRFAELPPDDRKALLAGQPDWVLRDMAKGEWWWTARPEQVPPDGEWFIALALAGRGWGKSRAGSEWLVERTQTHPNTRTGAPTEWLVIAETLSDARTICMEGESGILRVLNRRDIEHRYKQSPRPMILYPNGSKIYCEGADSPDVGRGYNAAGAWLDEIAKWNKPKEAWYEGIMPALRADLVGDFPRAFVTTTPKPITLLQEWLRRDDGTVHLMRGSTFDNASNLSSYVVSELRNRYENTALGRQELYGELIEGFEGALFTRQDLDRNRVDEVPDTLVEIAVGVDPNLTGEDDEMGVVVVGRTADNHLYVLADRSILSVGRQAALHAWRVLAEFGADKIICESNLGKRWMVQVFEDAYRELIREGLFDDGTQPPLEPVDVKTGKKTRAEPVAMRCEQGRLHMVGRFYGPKGEEHLEDQLVGFTGWDIKESPDRLDAMVHACRYLITKEKKASRMASPLDLPSTLRSIWADLDRW